MSRQLSTKGTFFGIHALHSTDWVPHDATCVLMLMEYKIARCVDVRFFVEMRSFPWKNYRLETSWDLNKAFESFWMCVAVNNNSLIKVFFFSRKGSSRHFMCPMWVYVKLTDSFKWLKICSKGYKLRRMRLLKRGWVVHKPELIFWVHYITFNWVYFVHKSI